MSDDVDDGSKHPIGYTTDDGCLQVREYLDEHGVRCVGFVETDFGQHTRWMRMAPDLFALYMAAVEEKQGETKA